MIFYTIYKEYYNINPQNMLAVIYKHKTLAKYKQINKSLKTNRERRGRSIKQNQTLKNSLGSHDIDSKSKKGKNKNLIFSIL